MRAPQKVLPASDRLRLVRLDVTSAQSIAEAAEVGEIDVLVAPGWGCLMPEAPARGDSQPVCHQYHGTVPGGDPRFRSAEADHR